MLATVLALVGSTGLERTHWTHGSAVSASQARPAPAHELAEAHQMATAPHHATPVPARGGLDIARVRPVLSSVTDRSVTQVSIEASVVLAAIKCAVSQRAPPVLDAV